MPAPKRDDAITREAARREASHHPGHRFYGDPRLRHGEENLMGLCGEEAFGKQFHLHVDLEKRLGGDGGKDFRIYLRDDQGNIRPYIVNCKAANWPKDLICRPEKLLPHVIYVLFKYHKDEVRCDPALGWLWGVELKRGELKDYGHGYLSHGVPREKIRSMDEIAARQAFMGDCKCGRIGLFVVDRYWYCGEHYAAAQEEWNAKHR